MQFELSLDDVSRLMMLLPAEAAGIQAGFSYADETLFVPSPWTSAVEEIPAEANWRVRSDRAALLAYAAERRWQIEVAGIFVAIEGEQVPVSTARGDDRAALHMTYSAIKNGLRREGAIFNFADGKPRAVSNEAMEAAILAALDHVQTAFDKGGEIRHAIETATIITREQVDAAFAR